MKITVVVVALERKEAGYGASKTVTHQAQLRSEEGPYGRFWGYVTFEANQPMPGEFMIGNRFEMELNPLAAAIPAQEQPEAPAETLASA